MNWVNLKQALPFYETKDKKRYESAVASYLKNYKDEFSVERDIYNLMGEQNIFRYLPLKNMFAPRSGCR